MRTEIITGPDQFNPADTAVALINPPAAWIDVLAERQRQVTGEGWTPEHDDQHARGEMAQAAGAYAMASTLYHANPRRDLVKAAALILAEIERLDRAALRHPDAAILHAEQQAEAAAERAGDQMPGVPHG